MHHWHWTCYSIAAIDGVAKTANTLNEKKHKYWTIRAATSCIQKQYEVSLVASERFAVLQMSRSQVYKSLKWQILSQILSSDSHLNFSSATVTTCLWKPLELWRISPSDRCWTPRNRKFWMPSNHDVDHYLKVSFQHLCLAFKYHCTVVSIVLDDWLTERFLEGINSWTETDNNTFDGTVNSSCQFRPQQTVTSCDKCIIYMQSDRSICQKLP